MKKILLIQIFLLFGACAVLAQVPTPSELEQVKVDNLTDDQVRQIVDEMKKNQIRLDQIDAFAKQKGIPAAEAAKLKDRIRALNLDGELIHKNTTPQLEQINADRSVSDGTTISARDIQPMSEADIRRSKLYGSELFNNKNLTFEPNLRMPTPPNYKLASGDELMIDVYGYSEVQFNLKVTPEGYIRIPNLGPVYVSGLTIEEARVRITKQLATIYSTIRSGNTSVQISLGNIRSIRVLLIGEVVRPGTYSVPSLATIANALYVSGGPDLNGSFRNIQLIRNGQPIVTFDLYDFLTKGDLTNNAVLQDQDIIKVNPYSNRVELSGEVKKPAIFEVKEGETLNDIINYAGGYTDIAYRDVIRAYRITAKEREITTIQQSEVANFIPRSGDKYFIDAILTRFKNRVIISGAVLHPGEYALDDKMTVADLIRKADGLKEDAARNRALIFRVRENLSPTSTNFSPDDVLSGKQQLLLNREDSVVIYSQLEQKESFHIKISGEVLNPGYYPFSDSLQIEDMVLMAGGLKDAASLKKVEVSRRVRKQDFSPTDSVTTIIAQFDITEDLKSASGFRLQPFDEIIVRKAPSYVEQANVMISGEVLYPGTYTINSKKERISDLINRAGGLKPESFTEGAFLLRKTYTTSADSTLFDSKLRVYMSKLHDTADISRVQQAMMQRDQLVDIDLDKIRDRPGSKYDLFLAEGDFINIPQREQTVQLLGEVYFPKKVRYESAIKFRDYIRGAGGFTVNALKRRSYVIYANGKVKGTRKILFFNSYPRLRPGAEIYVPRKAERRGLSTQEAVGITTGVASLALIIITVLDKIK